ncbi:hypothetical protein Rrhod_2274 [Rhodococcus rhodnii LMG 5362]|uniref:Uncharacterized protein n=1 Tax=Rhodococcus rhodnii LMG 5362 TaxID=1273125 RepID=R7WR62_9NOCA|nr:hypothetical protein Rrhod_2274 [Rhodococcus rhodnii LMG 5362]
MWADACSEGAIDTEGAAPTTDGTRNGESHRQFGG